MSKLKSNDRDMPAVAAIVGPTATGKSAIAMAIAERLNAEIVSADSMQVYRGMDAGTAKPTPDDRRRVRHHLVDVVAPDQEFSVHEYRLRAAAAIADVRSRGKLPLIVGGTGLYFTTLTSAVTLGPTDPEIRSRLNERLESDGICDLLEELADLDPAALDAIDKANPRRVVRALEIALIKSSEMPQADSDPYGQGPACREIGRDEERGAPVSLIGAAVSAPIEILTGRIEERCRAMFEAGLVDEVAKIFGPKPGRPVDDEAPRPPSATARQAVGYKEVAIALSEGNPPESAIPEIVGRTRRLARRQRAWFRKDPRLAWFSSSEPADLADAVRGYLRAGLDRTESEI